MSKGQNPYQLPVEKVENDGNVIYIVNNPDCEQISALREQFTARHKGCNILKRLHFENDTG